MKSRLTRFAVGAALPLCSCAEETTLSSAELERNFALDTRQLCISDACFNPDLNVAVIQLLEPPTEQFADALVSRGWQKQGDIYMNEELRCYLEYESQELQIIIKSTPYLPLRQNRKAAIPAAE